MGHRNKYELLLDAIEAERAQEEAYYQNVAADKTLREKFSAGILWHPCYILKKQFTVGELLEIQLEIQKEKLGPHKLKVGMGIHLFCKEPDLKIRGTISFLRKNKISIILNATEKAHAVIDQAKYGIELIYDERPYRVMRQALKTVQKEQRPFIMDLRDGLSANKMNPTHYKPDLNYNNNKLNEYQNKAVQHLANLRPVGIIHGPPGTGKTTTLVALIKYLCKSEKKILVCAASNNAVDLLARLLHQEKLPTLRIGNISRIKDDIADLTLNEKVRSHKDWAHIKKVKIEAEEARRQAVKRKRTFGAKERSNRNLMYQEFKALRSWARDIEHKLVDQIIDESQIIATTLIGASNQKINHLKFDTLIIDEASQALEPECWNAILKANRVILAGDHLQLPPTVKSAKAKEKGLATTLLDQLKDDENISFLLKEQYRMNDDILSFSNKHFYESKLISNAICATRKLSDAEPAVYFIDTSGCGFEEKRNHESRSLANEGEGFILREHLIAKMENYKDKSIGIISPYAQQVRNLQEMTSAEPLFNTLDLTINTIDGFQGQEKDIIYISLVRSNDNGEIGFLKDARRLNVALTRAKLKLIVIGDGATISSETIFNDLMTHVENLGGYQSAWEYMS